MTRNTSVMRCWRAEDLGEVELLLAEASHHAYARHVHDAYAIGIVEAGGHGFAARGKTWRAKPGDVITVNPDDPHDGFPLAAEGYSYRMLYLPVDLLAELLGEVTGAAARCPFFSRLVIHDPDAAAELAVAHRTLERGKGRLERESRLLLALAGLVDRHASAPPRRGGYALHRGVVGRARDRLEADLAADVSLGALAEGVGVSRFHLLRLFRAETGLPPHAWLMQRRLQHARQRLRAGEAPAAVAAALGFVDQSHLTRRFRAAYGVTPARYRQSNGVQA